MECCKICKISKSIYLAKFYSTTSLSRCVVDTLHIPLNCSLLFDQTGLIYSPSEITKEINVSFKKILMVAFIRFTHRTKRTFWNRKFLWKKQLFDANCNWKHGIPCSYVGSRNKGIIWLFKNWRFSHTGKSQTNWKVFFRRLQNASCMDVKVEIYRIPIRNLKQKCRDALKF